MTENKKQFLEWRAKINACLEPLIRSEDKFALLDFPNHANVGDSMIWMGETRFFRAYLKAIPSYVADHHRFSSSALVHHVPTGPIFLHGGGNFGDLWPAHQHFREEILRTFPDRPIIQLPQSIHFQDPQNLARAARAIHSHQNFTLLVRDKNSFKIATEHFKCPVFLCPDMALYLDPVTDKIQKTRDILYLLRSDHEKKSSMGEVQNLSPCEDWIMDPEGFEQQIRTGTIWRLPLILGADALNPAMRRFALYERLAQGRMMRGIKQIGSARYVITDRLHVHILCILMGIPHAVLDNSYGKIKSVSSVWIPEMPDVHFVDTLLQAIEMYQRARAA